MNYRFQLCALMLSLSCVAMARGRVPASAHGGQGGDVGDGALRSVLSCRLKPEFERQTAEIRAELHADNGLGDFKLWWYQEGKARPEEMVHLPAEGALLGKKVSNVKKIFDDLKYINGEDYGYVGSILSGAGLIYEIGGDSGSRTKLYFVLRSNFTQASVIEEAQDDVVRFYSFVCVKSDS